MRRRAAVAGDLDAARSAGATKCRSATSRRITPALIQKGMTAVEWLHQFDPDASRQDIHGLLGQMLFSGEEGLKPTEALSGGETARLLFCRIMLQKPNVLVLDEPTNHLDLESINALNIALQKFEGTVLLVTHDQDLMEEVGTRVWHFEAQPPRKLSWARPSASLDNADN
jgi:ATPase subunit of ABC transporter with duplicated ATPase domains